MKKFIQDILKSDFGDGYAHIYNQSLLLQYLDMKMGAVYGDSKTRRSLANIYAVYSILNFYVKDYYNQIDKYKKFGGFQYMHLFQFYRSLYGGERLQNHALNNRVNFEFRNKFQFDNAIIINNGCYALHIDLLYVENRDISKTIIKVVEKYIGLLQQKDMVLLQDLEDLSKINDVNDKRNKILSMLTEQSEARIFEIMAYAILKNSYKNSKIYWGYDKIKLYEERLMLYKTGRTNANDGGIDFVMKPLGRFFQVTEVMDCYDKYMLDIDKVMHFPITFVIKTHRTKTHMKAALNEYIDNKSGGMEMLKNRYKNAIEDIITINELQDGVNRLSESDINAVIADIDVYYRLEMNLPADIR